MRKAAVVPLILIVFGIALGAPERKPANSKISAASVDFMDRERQHATRTREFDSRENSGLDKTSNVKTRQRVSANPPRREPSIQAYGLPKRVFENNGFIERVPVTDRVSNTDEKMVGSKIGGEQAGIRAYGAEKNAVENNGFIELVGSDENLRSVRSASGNIDSGEIRRVRSIGDDGYAKNDLVDLEAQEAKVFRPLFVYRQQIADRYRTDPKKHPIYASYQYGFNKRRNSVRGGTRKYY